MAHIRQSRPDSGLGLKVKAELFILRWPHTGSLKTLEMIFPAMAAFANSARCPATEPEGNNSQCFQGLLPESQGQNLALNV